VGSGGGRAIPASAKKAIAEGGKRTGERPYLIDRWSTDLLRSINTKLSLLTLHVLTSSAALEDLK